MKWLIVSIVLLQVLCAKGQGLYDRNWYFGNRAGIRFDDTVVTALGNGQMPTLGAAATISDSLGNLLFYTNGQYIWNRRHEHMENDDSLYGYPFRGILNEAWVDSFGSLSTNGLLVLPVPGHANLFYVFAVLNHCYSAVPCTNAIVYQVVDMSQDSALGAVVQKNVHLDWTQRLLGEKISACRHANGRDWWLLAHELNSDKFLEWLVTPAGIEGPILQAAGNPHCFLQGEMFFSRNGERLCCLVKCGLVDEFAFDRCTGAIVLEHALGSPPYNVSSDTARNYFGGSFSPSGNKLYYANFDTIYEANLSFTNPQKQVVWVNPHPDTGVGTGFYYIQQFELGPDDKIYLDYTGSVSNTDTSYYYLSCINKPEQDAANCDFVVKQINLNPHRCWASLPNMPNYNLGRLIGSACDTLTTVSNLKLPRADWTLYPNPARNTVTIEHGYGSNALVTIEIYNVLGQLVKRTVTKSESTSVNVSQLPDGIYEVRLTANGVRQGARKLVLQ